MSQTRTLITNKTPITIEFDFLKSPVPEFIPDVLIIHTIKLKEFEIFKFLNNEFIQFLSDYLVKHLLKTEKEKELNLDAPEFDNPEISVDLSKYLFTLKDKK